MLYLDVLNAKGGNFSTGAPDGPLGGSEKTQVEGMQTIADYLRSKGTDLGTEGNRRFLEKNAEGLPRAGYVWLHGSGFSEDDYSVISGGSRALACQHTWGNAGAFNVSPIASTQPGLDRVRAHYAALLAGKPGTKAVASLNTLHIAKRDNGVKDEFDIPGTGDPYRGDWADLVNNFYLTAIQENCHIGKRNVRVKTVSARGRIHVGTYRLSQSGTSELKVLIPDFVTDWTGPGAREYGFKMLEEPIETTVTASKAGAYQGRLTYRSGGGRGDLMLNVYVNGSPHKAFETLPVEGQGAMEVDLGTIQLREGENTISFDTGAIQAQWSDGTMAEWSTPYLRKGFRAWNGDVVFATDYDRMWPDTWSGQKKIYFFSWDGTDRRWRLPADWTDASRATLYPLTPEGRGKGVPVAIKDRTLSPSLLPQVPYILVPETK